MATTAVIAPEEILTFENAKLGVIAFLVIDSTKLGPAAGGVRTASYSSHEAAKKDAVRLAKAMTLKCAIGGLDAGGAKCVVVESNFSNRRDTFSWLGEQFEKLDGRFRTGADLGTTAEDVQAMASTCQYVHAAGEDIGDAVARGVVAALNGAFRARGELVGNMSALVQGGGAMGKHVAALLQPLMRKLSICDVNAETARQVATATGANVVAAISNGVCSDYEVFAPCAVGGIVSSDNVKDIGCKVICGAANNVLADREAAFALHAKGIDYVPDFLASAGGVVDGIAKSVMGVADPVPMIEKLEAVSYAVVSESRSQGLSTVEVAEQLAFKRLFG